jgi:tetratricopeptide (TPR) repeat protein
MYFDLKEFENSKNYLAVYLSENSDDPLGWKLMAELAETSDKDYTKAVDCYAKCFEYNPQATPILLKICSCYKYLSSNLDEAVVITFKNRKFVVFK